MKQYFVIEEECKDIDKARVHRWFDTKLFKELFGVQVKLEKQAHRYFGHVLDCDGKPILFDTHEDAEHFIEELMFSDKEHQNDETT